MARNDYQERREARIERYEERAAKALAEASALHGRARQMGEAIPFGQPILVGHHSETRDRKATPSTRTITTATTAGACPATTGRGARTAEASRTLALWAGGCRP